MVVAVKLVAALLERIARYFTRPSWFSEVGSGIATLGWGLLAVNIETAGMWPSVELFKEVSSTPLWGLLAILLGLIQLGAFQSIERRWMTPWLRWGAACMAAWVWGAITFSTARTTAPWTPGISAYFGWWIVNIYLMSRIFWTRKWT